jgi:hypothetical protein
MLCPGNDDHPRNDKVSLWYREDTELELAHWALESVPQIGAWALTA